MSEQRSWTVSALPEQHLLPDVVVAFVDGELGDTARGRAEAHMGRCPMCAAELAVQRQARAAVRGAEAPSVPAGLLASLRAIPVDTDLPEGPTGMGGLAIGKDGQLVCVQRPDRVAAFGAGPAFGSSTPLGSGTNVLRSGAFHGRRAVQGAGVVAAGLVLGALAVVGPNVLNVAGPSPVEPAHPDGSSISGGAGANGIGARNDVVTANFATDVGGSVREPAALPTATSVPRHHAVQAR